MPPTSFIGARLCAVDRAPETWTRRVPLFDIVNDQKQADGIRSDAAAVCSFRSVSSVGRAAPL
jgi:hypothetical protein